MSEDSSFSTVRHGESAGLHRLEVVADDDALEGVALRLPADDGGGEVGTADGEAEECEVKVQKRQAASIAMGWLGSPQDVEAHDVQGRRGYCMLKVRVRGVWKEIIASSWWLCLRALQAHLVSVGLMPAPDAAPSEDEPPEDLRS